MTQRQTFFAAAAILLALFAIFLLLPDQQAGLDDDEALALWIVRDDVSMNAAPGDALRALRSNISQMIDRVQTQPQPPLYFIALDAGVMAAGESVLAARFFSTLWVMLALAATYAAGHSFDRRIALPVILPLSGVWFIFPAATAYVFGLLLLLAALSALALIRLSRQPSLSRAVIYTVLLIAAFDTHLAAGKKQVD